MAHEVWSSEKGKQSMSILAFDVSQAGAPYLKMFTYMAVHYGEVSKKPAAMVVHRY